MPIETLPDMADPLGQAGMYRAKELNLNPGAAADFWYWAPSPQRNVHPNVDWWVVAIGIAGTMPTTLTMLGSWRSVDPTAAAPVVEDDACVIAALQQNTLPVQIQYPIIGFRFDSPANVRIFIF